VEKPDRPIKNIENHLSVDIYLGGERKEVAKIRIRIYKKTREGEGELSLIISEEHTQSSTRKMAFEREEQTRGAWLTAHGSLENVAGNNGKGITLGSEAGGQVKPRERKEKRRMENIKGEVEEGGSRPLLPGNGEKSGSPPSGEGMQRHGLVGGAKE